MKRFLIKFGFYFTEYTVCFPLSALISALFAIPIRFIFPESLLGQRISFTVVDLICIFLCLFIAMAIEGFRSRKSNPLHLLVFFAIIFVLQQIIAILLDYAYLLCGPTGFLCEAIYFGNLPAIGENELRINWIPLWWETLCLAAFQIFIFLPALVFGEKFGVWYRNYRGKRLKQR